MKRSMQVGGAVLGGAALLGVGVAVGSHVGQSETVVVAGAGAQAGGGLSQSDTYMTQAFMNASRTFDALLNRVRKGDTKVGPAMTKQAVVVLSVKRAAQNEQLKDAADTASTAMLLIGAGVTANDGAAVKDGVTAYKDAQQKVMELGKTFSEGASGSPAPAASPVPSQTPAP